jgi:hypothetical protein
MSRELLCSWLEVPQTPWPPDYYALLGLPPGQGSTETIEQRVLERMEKLRRYQLLHPEPVTEGMNLLAQAMIRLTDPQTRRDYDQQQGLKSTAEPIPSEDAPMAQLIEVPAAAPSSTRPGRPALRETYGFEADIEPGPAPDILIPELADDRPAPPTEEEPDEPGPPPMEPPPSRQRLAESRRPFYADLVRIRRVLRVWENVRTYLDDPEKAFARRTETVAFMACLAELRPLLPTVSDLVGSSNQPGSLVAALARQQVVVEMLRSLLPSQREALARDCRQAHYLLLDRYRDLRAEMRRQTAKNFARRVCYPIRREIVARPEWLILALGLAALVIAFVRSVPH